MHVSFFVRECHDFLLYPEEGGGGGGGGGRVAGGAGGDLFYGLYGEAPPESLREGGGGRQQIFVRGGNVPRSPLPVEKTF